MISSVGFHTLGCKLNFSETATVARQFGEKGFDIVDFKDFADIYVINTCSVTENADRKCKKIVRKALKTNPNAFIIVMGCYAQLKPQEIAAIPGVDAVLGAAEKFRLFDILKDFNKNTITEIHHCQIQETTTFIPSFTLENRTRAFLKVQDGCDYKCSFCTIPLARGISRSASTNIILNEAKKLEASGAKEIVLTGVNIGDYGKFESNLSEAKFIDLIKILDAELTQIPRIRISSIEPNLLTDEIIEFVANSKRFMPHFHVPLQSGCDKILKTMRRRYQSDFYSVRIAKIKEIIPHACIGCDVIVGFPGETQQDFQETADFINNLDITYLHVFPFSERTNTLASEMSNSVSLGERYERSEILRYISEKKKNAFYDEHIGSTQNILFENEIENDLIFGFSENYIRVGISKEKYQDGEIAQVKIFDNFNGRYLIGKVYH